MVTTGSRSDKRIDVLHVSEAYGGGVQSAVNTYIRHTPELRHQLFIRGRLAHHNGEENPVESFHVEGSIYRFMASAARHINETNPHVVHLHSSYAGLLRGLPGIKANFVYSPHCFSFYRSDFHRLLRALYYCTEQLLSQRIQTIAAVSPHEAGIAARMTRRGSVRYLPNISGSHATGAAVRPKAREVDGGPAIVCVGRISKQKDPEFLAQCLQFVDSPVRCVWVGDGDVRLRKALEQAGVFVTGWVSSEAAQKYIAEADLFLHTAEWEGAPITLVDAAAIGVPVIVRSIQHLEGLGFTGGGQTPIELAATVNKFLLDESFRNDVAARTRETAAVHSSTAQRRALLALYKASDRVG